MRADIVCFFNRGCDMTQITAIEWNLLYSVAALFVCVLRFPVWPHYASVFGGDCILRAVCLCGIPFRITFYPCVL